MKGAEIGALLERYGPFQRRLFLLMTFPLIMKGYQSMSIVITFFSPQHRCQIPGLANDTYTVQSEAHRMMLNLSVPMTSSDGDVSYSKCEVYKDRDVAHANRTLYDDTTACSSWVYDRSEFDTTIVTQFDLVCGSKGFRAFCNTIYMIGVLISSPLSGFFGDRFGRKKVVYIGMVTCLVMSGLMAYPVVPEILLVYRFVAGVAGMAFYLASYTLCLEFMGPSQRSLSGMLLMVLWLIGPFMVGALSFVIRDWRWIQVLSSAPFVFCVGYWWFIPESPRWLLSKGREKEARAILRKVVEVNKLTLPPDHGPLKEACAPDSHLLDNKVPVNGVALISYSTRREEKKDGKEGQTRDVQWKNETNKEMKDETEKERKNDVNEDRTNEMDKQRKNELDEEKKKGIDTLSENETSEERKNEDKEGKNEMDTERDNEAYEEREKRTDKGSGTDDEGKTQTDSEETGKDGATERDKEETETDQRRETDKEKETETDQLRETDKEKENETGTETKLEEDAGNETKISIEIEMDKVLERKVDKDNKGDNEEGKHDGPLMLLKYPNVIARMCIIAFNWAAVSMTYYGLSLNVSNMAGSVRVNFLLSNIVELVGYLVSWSLIDRLGPEVDTLRLHVAVRHFLSGLHLPHCFGGGQWITTALAMSGKLGISAAFNTVYLMSGELLPTTIRNMAMGTCCTIGRIASALSPYIVDVALYIEGAWGHAIPLTVFGSVAMAAGLLALCLPETLHRTLPDTIRQASDFTKQKSKIKQDEEEKRKTEAKNQRELTEPV